MALLRNLVGGEVLEYTKLLAESREQALDRMVDDARSLGANAVIEIRFTTSMLMGGQPSSSRSAPRWSSKMSRLDDGEAETVGTGPPNHAVSCCRLRRAASLPTAGRSLRCE